ncbi:MAG: hypothetical protein NT007_11255 [Candidatus Kapabacteria bacterium]|nr:hypothetical protein [Candidatus Kapabacteria bacterium]
MNFQYRLIILLFSFFIVINYKASAILTLQIKDIAFQEQVEVNSYPYFSVYVKANLNGNQVPLDILNFQLVEDNVSSTPVEVVSSTGGWQKVKWYSRTRSFQTNGWADVVAVYSNEVAQKRANYNFVNNFKVIFKASNGADKSQIEEMDFGFVSPGVEYDKQVRVWPFIGKIDSSGTAKYIMIDSIKSHTPYFSVNWQGNSDQMYPPPVKAQIGFDYLNDIFFKPPDTNYHRDKISVYYEGGARTDLFVSGNRYYIPSKTLLNLTNPNGGEIFQPCDNVPIKWKGNLKAAPVKVEFSSNRGQNWTSLGDIIDTVTYWSVPNIKSDYCYFKISQQFKQLSLKTLSVEGRAISAMNFSSDGTHFLLAQDNAKIFEWNLISFTYSQPYLITDLISSDLYNQSKIKSIEYLPGDQKFAVLFQLTDGSIYSPDSVAYFKVGSYSPERKIEYNPNYGFKKAQFDSKKQFFAAIPDFGSTLNIFRTSDAGLEKTLQFNSIIRTFCFNKELDTAAVVLMNGDIHLISVPNFNILKTMNFPDIPLVIQMSLSRNGKYLGLACQTPTVSSSASPGTNQLHIVQLDLGDIILTKRNNGSDPVGLDFNVVSTTMMVGTGYYPQIKLWNLQNQTYNDATGVSGQLQSISFSPDGHFYVAASGNEINYIGFSYPEQDSSDRPFRVAFPSLKYDSLICDKVYLGDTLTRSFKSFINNNGEVPAYLRRSSFTNAMNFFLTKSMVPDTIIPGNYKDIVINFVPIDTGKLTDTLTLSTCTIDFKINMNGIGLPRHLTIINKLNDFGEQCVGTPIIKEIEICRNDDPVPIKINSLKMKKTYLSAFSFVSPISDTILKPGEILKVKIQFRPDAIGQISDSLLIYHSNQIKHYVVNKFTGTGIGTNVSVSHQYLLFVPEILSRKIKIKNKSNNSIVLQQANITPAAGFTFLTALPVNFNIGDEKEVEIAWNGTDKTSSFLNLILTPCASTEAISLGFYSSNVQVSIPTIKADPREQATIPINFKSDEFRPYNGIRSFKTEFSIHPGLFLPQSAKSVYGTVQIIKNEIVADKRIVGINVDGDFPHDGVAAEIIGVAGLAETDTSTIIINQFSNFWGKAVNVSTQNGFFQLINLCGNRRILNNPSLKIINISPNPSSGNARLDFYSDNKQMHKIEIFDELATKVYETELQTTSIGDNSCYLELNNLFNGVYKVMIRQGTNFSVINLMVAK